MNKGSKTKKGINKSLIRLYDSDSERKAKAIFGFENMFQDYLSQLNVPFTDTCCLSLTEGNFPVRWNNEEDSLQKFTGTDWENISGAGGGWGYTGTIATLTGNSVVDLDGNTLTFSGGNVGIGATPTADQLFVVNDGSNNFIFLDSSAREAFYGMVSADGNETAFIDFIANSGGDGVAFNIVANDNVSDQLSIYGDAVAQTITLTAATVNISNLAGIGSRAVVADADGNLSAP